ncbi:MAG: hypothetical protein IJJ33_19815 [Victivallales bacterium]|nr:hypothetical protein [Victivallales bacterium]
MMLNKCAVMFLLAGACILSSRGGNLDFSLDSRETMPSGAQGLLLDADSFMPGVVGNGLALTGHEGAMVMLPTDFGAKPLTVAGYFRPDHFPHGSMMTIASFFHHPREILALKIKDGQLLAMDWGVFAKATTIPIGSPLTRGEWHHVTWQLTGTEWVFFLDGKRVHSLQTAMLPAIAQCDRFLLGCDYNHIVAYRHFWIGMLDEITVREGILSPEECGFKATALEAAPEITEIRLVGARNIGKTEHVPEVTVDADKQCFVIDGKREPVMIYAAGTAASSHYAFGSFLECRRQSGITVIRLEITPRDFRMGEWWYAPGKYDFTEIDLWMDQVVRRVPDARILLQLPMSPPTWWGIANPNEETCDFLGNRVRDYHASHSFSSRKWMEDLEQALTALFAHLEGTPYHKRIIGYVAVSGLYNEAFRWGYNSKYKELTDYSVPERRGFQEWQKALYGTVEKRNAARPMEQAVETFETAQLPTPAERLLHDNYFVNPVRDRNTIDYLQYLNMNHPQRIGEFTAIIRRLAGPGKVIGLYYGYVFSDSYGHGRTFSNESGHYGLARALELPNVDFLLDSMAHYQREMGNAGPTAGAPAACQLHGKLWMDEADIRTSLSQGVAEYSGAKNLEESLGILWRAFGTIQINRSGLWWFPIDGRNAYSHPQIWEAFGRMYREMEYMAAHPASADRTKMVAFIMDSRAIHFRHYSKNDPVGGNLITGLLGPVAKAGIGYHLHIIEDLERIPDDYPVYVFLNSFHLSPAQRHVIQRRFQQPGKLVVWSYGAGFFTGEPDAPYACGTANVASLVGMDIQAVTKPATLPAAGINEPLSPIFYVEDAQATAWERFEQTGASDLDGKCATAIKRLPNGAKSLYVGIPCWTPQLLRRIALENGAHVYSSDEPEYVLRAGNGHILLHTLAGRQAHIVLPTAARLVVDVATGKTVAERCRDFTIEIPGRNSRYLRIEQ